MTVLRVDGLSFTYPGSLHPVLEEIHLTIPRGEFVLLAGPSGCGKSTLAMAIAGLIPARITGRTLGNVYLDGVAMARLPLHEVSQRIGMVFQNPDHQLIHLDVEAEVAFGPENLGLPADEIARRVRTALEHTGMTEFRHRQIYTLSGGQKQRVAIAATLAMQPEVLVLDEPTSDLDPVGTQDVLRVLRALNEQQGMTIVLVEHKIDEVAPWVDRILLMDAGRIVADTSARAAFVDMSPWHRLGVSVPEVAQLAHAIPEPFGRRMPLSVEDAVAALQGTSYAQALRPGAHAVSTAMQGDRPTSRADTALLAWQRVHLQYDDVCVLTSVDLSIHSQEWVALIGPNGSGKTSLASLAMGFQAPTGGRVTYAGEPVKTGDVSRQALHVSYLFQSADTMLFAPTVAQELQFGVRHRRKHSATQPVRIEEVLDMTDLAMDVQRNPFHLSHGQRKRLAMGALLTAGPRVMILDEPTTGQDEGHANAFLAFLDDLRCRHACTYLMITHDMRAVAQYATCVAVLYEGRVALQGEPASVFARREELALASIVPPPMARLHSILTEGRAQRVALTVSGLLAALMRQGVTTG